MTRYEVKAVKTEGRDVQPNVPYIDPHPYCDIDRWKTHFDEDDTTNVSAE